MSLIRLRKAPRLMTQSKLWLRLFQTDMFQYIIVEKVKERNQHYSNSFIFLHIDVMNIFYTHNYITLLLLYLKPIFQFFMISSNHKYTILILLCKANEKPYKTEATKPVRILTTEYVMQIWKCCKEEITCVQQLSQTIHLRISLNWLYKRKSKRNDQKKNHQKSPLLISSFGYI